MVKQNSVNEGWNRENINKMAKKVGVKVADLIVEDRSNDPFYLVTREASTKAKWFADMYKTVMAQFPNIRPHLRRLHYAYSSMLHAQRHDGTPYLNDYNSWIYLLNCSKEARYNGLVGFDQFQDRRNPEAQINADFTTLHKEWEAPTWIVLTSQDIDSLHTLDLQIGYPRYNDGDELAEALAEVCTRNLAEELSYNVQKLQPYHLEVWIEKSTMNDELEPVCKRFNANFVYGLGQESITRVDELVRRVLESEKPVRIFYISDYDSQGSTMPETVARKIQFYNEYYHNNQLDIKIHHLALTAQQVEQYKLPKKPTRTPQASSELERRLNGEALQKHRDRLEKYGATLRKRQPYSVELDALATFHVGEIERLLTEALSCFYDENLEAKVNEAIEAFKREVHDHVEDGVSLNSPEITDVIEKINSFYEDVNAKLRELHQEALKIKGKVVELKLYEKLEELQNEYVDLEELKLQLPEPKVNNTFNGAWLYDNTLDYVEQTQRLKSHRLGKEEK